MNLLDGLRLALIFAIFNKSTLILDCGELSDIFCESELIILGNFSVSCLLMSLSNSLVVKKNINQNFFKKYEPIKNPFTQF